MFERVCESKRLGVNVEKNKVFDLGREEFAPQVELEMNDEIIGVVNAFKHMVS